MVRKEKLRVNKSEFMNELRIRLRRLPPDEIENAVNYYEEYFNDAGPKNERQTIDALGSPSIVASKIIGEFAVSDAVKDRDAERVQAEESKRHKKVSPLIITILAVCASPIALPIAICVVVLVLSLAIVLFSFIISGAAITIAGVFSMVTSLWTFTYGYGTGLFYLGMSMLLFVLGAIITYSSVRLGRVVFRGVQKLLGKLLIRRGEK